MPVATPSDRLDGWKAIAGHFGRDRTTVIRWARDRGLPVHRLPGGRVGTVYALRAELDQWAASDGEPAREADTDEPLPTPSATPVAPIWRRRRAVQMALALTLVGAPMMILLTAQAPATKAERGPPASVASRFLTARDLVAERDAMGIERGIGLLEQVVRDAPDYAPAHASLAEALILSREFGVRDDAEAFGRARIAARTAARLAPDLAAAERLLGFIAYWADSDFPQAEHHMRRAIALDPDDALGHFWFGNILSDHGEHQAALRELDQARMALPGSVAIRTDLAWARWAAGDMAGIAELETIARRHPDFAVAQECLAITALMQGDAQRYVAHYERYAQSRRDPHTLAAAAAARQALAAGHKQVLKTILAQATSDLTHRPAGNHVWAVTIASLLGDRQLVMHLLQTAERRRERWGEAGLVERVRRRWRDDAVVQRQLADRTTRS